MLKNPANRRRAVGLTFAQWQYTFTNGFPEEESRRLYERYPSRRPERILLDSVLANIHRGREETWVNDNNDHRAPLLFISGSEDHLMPPSIQRSNAKHWNDNASPRSRSSRGRICCPRPPGWEKVADYALDWALEHAALPSTR